MSRLLQKVSRQAVLPLLCSVLATGCQRAGPPLVEVSGQITLDGAPVTGALVTFLAAGGQMSSGAIDSDGQYRLHCQFGPGVPAGQYQVLVLPAERIDAKDRERMSATGTPPRPPSPIPDRYQRPGAEGMQAVVEPPGPMRLNFSLTTH